MKQNEMVICLWFDDQAEEAVHFYTSIFRDSEIGQKSRFGKEGFEFHGKPEGTVMTIDFTLNQMKFIALNGGPNFKFNESISIIIYCDTQEEIDYYWTKLTEEGEESQCGWLKDKFGLSWQITPTVLPVYLTDTDNEKRNRVSNISFQMTKFDIERLNQAYEGKERTTTAHEPAMQRRHGQEFG
jgi:predicted 3-demethylubiquinone-9 3-methyltransferase (glyoxalase superfamily)